MRKNLSIIFILAVSLMVSCTKSNVKNDKREISSTTEMMNFQEIKSELQISKSFGEYSSAIVKYYPGVKEIVLGNLEAYKDRNDDALNVLQSKKSTKKQKGEALDNLIQLTENSIEEQKPFLALASENILIELQSDVKLLKQYRIHQKYPNAQARITAANKEIDLILNSIKSL